MLSFPIWGCVRDQLLKIFPACWIRSESSPEKLKCILYFLNCAVESLLALRHSNKSPVTCSTTSTVAAAQTSLVWSVSRWRAWCSAADKVLCAGTQIMGSSEPQKCFCLWNVSPCPVKSGLLSQYRTAWMIMTFNSYSLGLDLSLILRGEKLSNSVPVPWAI